MYVFGQREGLIQQLQTTLPKSALLSHTFLTTPQLVSHCMCVIFAINSMATTSNVHRPNLTFHRGALHSASADDASQTTWLHTPPLTSSSQAARMSLHAAMVQYGNFQFMALPALRCSWSLAHSHHPSELSSTCSKLFGYFISPLTVVTDLRVSTQFGHHLHGPSTSIRQVLCIGRSMPSTCRRRCLPCRHLLSSFPPPPNGLAHSSGTA